MRSATFPVFLAVAVALAIPGCSVERHVTGPLPWQTSVRSPAPGSPANAIRLFEWGWNNRDLDAFKNLLTADFRFVFALSDSAGNLFRDEPFGREQMLGCLRNLFTGGGPEPPATSIRLVLDPELLVLPDSRAGMDPAWHKEIVTSVDLAIKTAAGAEYRVVGNARFFVVRGDSALIPQELGLVPDSTRWFIQRWQDETLQGAGAMLRALPAAPQPADNVTWGQILALYY